MHASKTLVGAAVCALTLLGCGATATSGMPLGTTTTARPTAPIATANGADRAMALEMMTAASDDEHGTADLSSLPPAPWASDRLPIQTAPAAVVRAWRSADNRTWCAPFAPATLGGARARTGEVEGGWMVEFDRAGAPGVLANGRTCARCGRAAFGIVGTSMTPDQLDEAEPAFSDGSRTAIEAPTERGEAAAATITVTGQGCVYQVWSFLGEEHLHSLVDSLRFVDVADAHAIASVDDSGRK